jgi:sarcosine oxidase
MAFEGPAYVPLARRAFALWDELGAATQAPLLLTTGALYLGASTAGLVELSRASAAAHGVPHQHLDAAAVRRRFPAFAVPDDMVGLLEHRAGILRPEACIAAMLAEARRHGAELRLDEPLLAWEDSAEGVRVRTPSGTIQAGALILATGAWMPTEVASLGVRLEVERVVQHWFRPDGDASRLAPERCPVYLCEDPDTTIFYGFPLLDGLVKCAVHHKGEITSPDSARRTVTEEEVERVRMYADRFVPGAAAKHVRSAVCLYTNTPDGHFIVDRHPAHRRVVLVSACNGVGFKFAPVIGEAAAQLARGGAAPAILAPFAMTRFG